MVKTVGNSLMEVIDRVDQISVRITEIAHGTAQQAQGLDEINTGVSHLDEVTQQNAAMGEEGTAPAHNLGRFAAELTSSMERFALAQGRGAVGTPEADRGAIWRCAS